MSSQGIHERGGGSSPTTIKHPKKCFFRGVRVGVITWMPFIFNKSKHLHRRVYPNTKSWCKGILEGVWIKHNLR